MPSVSASISIPSAFLRYRAIVDDWEAFVAALRRPLPVCAWTNTLRTTPAQVKAALEAEGLKPEPLAWRPDAFRLPSDSQPGNRLAYVLGHYHVQEEVSLLPVPLLDPQPGERVLDLCAAPGGKTAQIAVRMQNRGTVVANDRNPLRLRQLSGTIERLGLLNVTTTLHDGADYPLESGPFDRVLVDVPCSCEGNFRKDQQVADAFAGAPELCGLQTALLHRAVMLCRPGGRIVYATCTFAPEENELVVDAVLRRWGEALRLLPAHLEGFRGAPGLIEWNGRRLHPSLEQTLRVWPHLNDTGGFFVAVLERQA